MTQRKPAEMTFESWVDVQLNQAQKRGAFDNLPGKGQAIAGLDEVHDETWWVKNKLRDEKLNGAPRTIEMRRKAERFVETYLSLPSEWTLRNKATALNKEINEANRGDLGPLLPQKRLDIEQLCQEWHKHRT